MAEKKGSNNLGRARVLGDETILGLAVDNEGFVEAGFHAIIDGDIPLFQWGAILFDLFFDGSLDGREDGPGGSVLGEGE